MKSYEARSSNIPASRFVFLYGEKIARVARPRWKISRNDSFALFSLKVAHLEKSSDNINYSLELFLMNTILKNDIREYNNLSKSLRLFYTALHNKSS